MAGAARIVVDYSSGLAKARLPNVAVVRQTAEKEGYGDPPTRQAYTAAFLEAVKEGPTPVVCVVGPYGYSPAFTAASGARNELGREKVDPNLVHVVNTGRAYLGLGAETAAAATAEQGPEALMAWLAEGPNVNAWTVVRTERLVRAPAEWHIETPKGLPGEEFTLLRVRLSARVMGGFGSVRAAVAEALDRSAVAGPAYALTAAGLGMTTAELARMLPATHRLDEAPAGWLAGELGETLSFAIAQIPRGGA